MDPTKPGYTTTEFWLALLTNLAAGVALLSPQLGVKLSDPATVQAVSIIAAALANVVYTVARSHVKAAAAHPLAYAPVPKGAAATSSADTLAFHSGVAGGGPGERADYQAVSDDQHAKALSEHARAVQKAARPARPVRKR
jgi:hypothetical protein